MEKIKSNLPLCLLLSYLIKIIVVTPTLHDAYILIALIGLTAFFKKEESNDAVKIYQDQVKAIEEKHIKLAAEFREIQSALQATKLINSVKTFAGSNSGR